MFNKSECISTKLQATFSWRARSSMKIWPNRSKLLLNQTLSDSLTTSISPSLLLFTLSPRPFSVSVCKSFTSHKLLKEPTLSLFPKTLAILSKSTQEVSLSSKSLLFSMNSTSLMSPANLLSLASSILWTTDASTPMERMKLHLNFQSREKLPRQSWPIEKYALKLPIPSAIVLLRSKLSSIQETSSIVTIRKLVRSTTLLLRTEAASHIFWTMITTKF